MDLHIEYEAGAKAAEGISVIAEENSIYAGTFAEEAAGENAAARETGNPWQENAERSSLPCYSYTKAYLDENGTFHPQRVNGIYEHALEDPAVRETTDYLKEWSHQETLMSCAVNCQTEITNVMTEYRVSERELLELGKEKGWYSDDIGTYTSDRGKLAEFFGLEKEHYSESLTCRDLAQLRADGVGLIVSVDGKLLENPFLQKQCQVNHSVLVVGFDYSDAENPKVIINDPGHAQGRGLAYPVAWFERAADADSNGRIYSVTAIYQRGQRYNG